MEMGFHFVICHKHWKCNQNPSIFLTNAAQLETRHTNPRRWKFYIPWWRHQMEAFSALLALFTGNSPVPGEFPTQRPVTRSLDVFFDLRPNKRLRKQSWGWWFETLSRPLWRNCYAPLAQVLSKLFCGRRCKPLIWYHCCWDNSCGCALIIIFVSLWTI